MILEGPMIIIASGALTAFHPGFCFGREWRALGRSQDRSEAKEARKTEENVQLMDL